MACRATITFNDALGRDGGCQGCHPAHRSNGDMTGYPITSVGANFNAAGDNRLGLGGCFSGRDVHSNPNKDTDGAGTPEHLTAVGAWLSTNVFRNQQSQPGGTQAIRGIWCTNCHTQLSQEIWKTKDCADLVHSTSGTSSTCLVNPRGASSLANLATALGTTQSQILSWLDPKTTNAVDDTHRVWDPSTTDANLATIEVNASGSPVGTTDADGDFSVNVLSFCTTADCVSQINANKTGTWAHKVNSFINPTADHGAAVPFNAATDGRDHWLAAGEPHCADCHTAPYVEQSGNINFFPPFNYPRKASLMRYSRGHRDITCQGCHESIHGLYPVGPVDTTSYAQAASLNTDGSHGPLKCGACHWANSSGVNVRANNLQYNSTTISSNFDAAVSWQHVYTNDTSPRGGASGSTPLCQNCHSDHTPSISNDKWLVHNDRGRASRKAMDQAEMEVNGGYPFGAKPGQNPLTTVCRGCHSDNSSNVSCSNIKWMQHLPLGRVSPVVFGNVSQTRTGTTCGW